MCGMGGWGGWLGPGPRGHGPGARRSDLPEVSSTSLRSRISSVDVQCGQRKGGSGLSVAYGSKVLKTVGVLDWESVTNLFGDIISFKPPSGSGQNHFGLGATISLGLGVRALRLATAVFAALRGQRVSLWLPLNFGCNEHTDKFEQSTSGKSYPIQRNWVETGHTLRPSL